MFYFTKRAISLNLGCWAVRKRAKRAASVHNCRTIKL